MFYLKDKKKTVTAIEAIVSINGRKYKYATGQSVAPDGWKGNRAKFNKQYPAGKTINAQLEQIEKAVDNTLSFYRNKNIYPSPDEFRKKTDEFLNKSHCKVNKLTTSIENFYQAKNYKYETAKKYVTAINKLEKYEHDRQKVLYFDEIGIDWYNDFSGWFFGQINPKTGLPYTSNYFGSIIKVVKKVMRSGLENGLHTNFGFQHSEFTVDSEASDSVYLNDDELKEIYKLEITTEKVTKLIREKATEENTVPDFRKHNIERKTLAMKGVRARFLIGAYTALRISDFNRLHEYYFSDGFLRISTQKTNTPLVIPVHYVVKEIIENGGLNYQASEQKINKHIKDVCRLAGIDKAVTLSRKHGNQTFTTTRPKYELITSHTARRSAATNMYKAGIPAISIMKITGHTTENSFMKYIKISQEENAELLKNHPFFNLL